MMNSDGASPGPEVRTQAHWASDDSSSATASPAPPINSTSSTARPPITNARPFVAAYDQHGARVKGRGRQPSIPVLHALEIVTARPRLPGGDGAVSNVPPAEGSTGNRRGLRGDGHRVVGGRGPKVIAQPIEWLV